ncbi:O-methyltransferase [Flavobacterium sp. FlaQc-30]|uniref:O-methyltransferase n=1 Tax=Flavobacterium sp. FlaQc-30 TaxID=3374179 RepID=UPI00375767AD
MNSPKHLNYETRPAKFTERKMLLSSFLRLCNFFKGEYQYIGFGGLSFTDFKLFHKELHINDMSSIEAGLEIEKVKFNSPYSFINIFHELSSEALTKIDLNKKTLVWLDYDGTLDNYMFEDLAILFNRLPVGSIYLMSCNKELKSAETGYIYTVEQFQEKFDGLVPFGIKDQNFSGSEDHKTIKKIFTNLIRKTVKNRNLIGENIYFHQLYNIIYQENRGARMFTFGGVLTSNETKFDDLNLSDFDFISNDDTVYKINLPNLTTKEIDLINLHLSNIEEAETLAKTKIVTISEINKYKAIYKYLPNFYDVRL